MPVAANCSVSPLTTLGSAGVTAIETSVALMTVRAVDPLTDPSAAVMVDEPVATVDIKPVVAIVATARSDEVQVTWLVMLAVEWSV